jgi:hypothetical protein
MSEEEELLLELLPDDFPVDDVTNISAKVEITFDVPKHVTGEGEAFQPIRERYIDEDEMAKLFRGTDWSHTPAIKLPSDYRSRDRCSLWVQLDEDDNE